MHLWSRPVQTCHLRKPSWQNQSMAPDAQLLPCLHLVPWLCLPVSLSESYVYRILGYYASWTARGKIYSWYHSFCWIGHLRLSWEYFYSLLALSVSPPLCLLVVQFVFSSDILLWHDMVTVVIMLSWAECEKEIYSWYQTLPESLPEDTMGIISIRSPSIPDSLSRSFLLDLNSYQGQTWLSRARTITDEFL